MKKIEAKNGTKRYMFEKGDGVRRRFLPFMEEWRVRLPDPKKYVPRTQLRHTRLRHPQKWYLDEKHILQRPSMGLLSLAQFAEWMLYMTQMKAQGSKAHVAATKLFLYIQRRMRAYMYRQGLDRPLTRKTTAVYKGAARIALEKARYAYGLYVQLESSKKKPKKRSKAIKPLDTIRNDMV